MAQDVGQLMQQQYIVLSDALIDVYYAQIQPNIIQDPTLTLRITKSLKAFIDDVAFSASMAPSNHHDLINTTQT